MKLSAPKNVTFWVGVVIGLLGLLSQLGMFTMIPIAAFWLLFIGFVILVLGNIVKGL